MLVKIAIPVADGRLAGHFREVKFFAVVDARNGKPAPMSARKSLPRRHTSPVRCRAGSANKAFKF